MSDKTPLLSIQDLSVEFKTRDSVVQVLHDVSLDVYEGETLGIVGESGCGKSMTALGVMRLIPMPPGRYTGGRILLRGEDLLTAADERIHDIRGNEISMIFQEPMTSLNPVYTVGNQIAETVRLHQDVGQREAHDRAVEMLQAVGIPAPGTPGLRISPSIVRRHAATGHDRDGAGLQPGGADRRRTDDGARCYRPGADL